MISPSFLSILATCFSIGTIKDMYFSVFFPKEVKRFLNSSDNSSKLARNIPGIFAQCSLSVALFETSTEHLGNIFMEKIF